MRRRRDAQSSAPVALEATVAPRVDSDLKRVVFGRAQLAELAVLRPRPAVDLGVTARPKHVAWSPARIGGAPKALPQQRQVQPGAQL